jgi:hypothetical protein
MQNNKPLDIVNMNDKELLAYLHNEDNFKKPETIMQKPNAEYSAVPPKPSFFRYFAKPDKETKQEGLGALNVVGIHSAVQAEQVNTIQPAMTPFAPEHKVDIGISQVVPEESDAILAMQSDSPLVSDELTHLVTPPERVEMPEKLVNALEELTSSVEHIISSLPKQADMTDVWQPLVEGMKNMTAKRERLLEIEKMFDQTVDEMNALRVDICTVLESIKQFEVERARSLQARLQLASSLQEKLQSIS